MKTNKTTKFVEPSKKEMTRQWHSMMEEAVASGDYEHAHQLTMMWEEWKALGKV